MDTYDSWLELLNESTQNIDLGSYYWTMRQEDVVDDPSAWKVRGYLVIESDMDYIVFFLGKRKRKIQVESVEKTAQSDVSC